MHSALANKNNGYTQELLSSWHTQRPKMITDLPNKRIPIHLLIFQFTNDDNDPNTAQDQPMDTQSMNSHIHLHLHAMINNHNQKIPSVTHSRMTITMNASPTMISMTKTKTMAMKTPSLHTTMDTPTTKALHNTSAMATIHLYPPASNGCAPSWNF